MKVDLRIATPRDEEALWGLFSVILAEGTTYAADEKTSPTSFLTDWFGRGGEQWVAESQGRLVGAYTLRSNQPGHGAHIATAGYGVSAAAPDWESALPSARTRLRELGRWAMRPFNSTWW